MWLWLLCELSIQQHLMHEDIRNVVRLRLSICASLRYRIMGRVLATDATCGGPEASAAFYPFLCRLLFYCGC
jgi:hypothetical protein